MAAIGKKKGIPINKKKREKSEITRIGQAYFATILFLLCLTGVICGAAAAGNNTRRLSTGESGTVLALSQREQSLEITVSEQGYVINTMETEKLAAAGKILPAPLSAFFWLVECAFKTAVL